MMNKASRADHEVSHNELAVGYSEYGSYIGDDDISSPEADHIDGLVSKWCAYTA